MRPPVSDLADLLPGLSPDAVQAFAARSIRRDSAASFQALLAAVTDSVRSTREPVRQAEGAALTLCQRQTVAAVAARLDALAEALGTGVSESAACLRRPPSRVRSVLRPSPGWLPRLRERAAEIAAPGGLMPTWISAAGAAVEALGQTAAHVQTLGAAQPAESSAHILAGRVAEALREGRDALLADVARLVD